MWTNKAVLQTAQKHIETLIFDGSISDIKRGRTRFIASSCFKCVENLRFIGHRVMRQNSVEGLVLVLVHIDVMSDQVIT
ncbi:predicted protein [Botrytis cinerea T4]|uniref:Uncharacterized protein n=1 Tax=Botryotinia fuckeliana (strain T4) TaxID=999810 RepID=G2Y2E6_BOTF4|nr:predicted protein [Botrytis cinerea T4]